MKKILTSALFLLFTATVASAQEAPRNIMGLKTNLLYWGTTTPNMGLELKLSPSSTLAIDGMYNPFEFENNKQLKLWAVQPEYRYWLCDTFRGHFFGVHAHYGEYNVALNTFRNDGYLVGGGLSYGYQFYLGRSWRLEATIGAGYAYMDYKRYMREACRGYLSHEYKNYFGITKAGISFVFLIH